MNEIDDELQFVEALKVRQLRWIAGAHERFESSPNELARSTAEHGLFAKEIRFRLLFESCLDHARARATNAFRPSQCRLFRETGEVLMNRDQAGSATASNKFPAHHWSQPFRRDHDNIDILSRNDRSILNGKAVGKEKRFPWPKMRSDLLFVDRRHLGIGQRKENDICAAHCFRCIENFESAAARSRA